jgi:zinc transporter, ZIP family
MPLSIQAGLWGLLSGSALVLGAAVGAFVALPQRVIAAIMAFGAGVLISALSFDGNRAI